MIKRAFDMLASLAVLMLTSPILISAMIAIWLQGFHSPFYITPRVGKDGTLFEMIKLRSMVVAADKTGVDSTSADDPRITSVGRFIRAYKLDELPQLLNVLKGDMSLVGPRPQVERDVAIYTDVERHLLSVKPGFTDISSIVFTDESEILRNSQDADIAYNQLIRPWKSRLGLLYIDNQSLLLDLRLLRISGVAFFSRKRALTRIWGLLEDLGAEEVLRRVAKRETKLTPFPPPGAGEIVTHR